MDIADFIPTSKMYYVSILVCIFRTRDGLANKKSLVGISKNFIKRNRMHRVK